MPCLQLGQILVVGKLGLFLNLLAENVAVLFILFLALREFFLPFRIILDVFRALGLQFFPKPPDLLVLLHLGKQLKLCKIFSHFFELKLIICQFDLEEVELIFILFARMQFDFGVGMKSKKMHAELGRYVDVVDG